LGTTEDIIGFLGENPAAPLWLANVLGGETFSALVDSYWYAEAVEKNQNSNLSGARSIQTVQVGLLNFRMLNGGPFEGINFPIGTSVDTFYISETLINATAWEAFLEQQPQFRTEQTHQYTFDNPGGGISGISWYAAKAFCEWLSAFLPPRYASWEIRLPTEAEWEYAAKAEVLGSGVFWEWCEEPYAPLSFLSVLPAAAIALGSPERPLRGGSWINSPGSVDIETRASLPPSFSSPFVSFRPVIAQKRNNQ
jgi:formylglycine-generating enzyme required for sulfatase activity